MASSTTYEVYVLQGSRWEIHSRYPASQKEPALKEAKALEQLPSISQVKIVREDYEADTGAADETTVYKTMTVASGRAAGGSSSASSSASSSGSFARGGGGGGFDPFEDDDDDDDDYDDDWEDEKKRPKRGAKTAPTPTTAVGLLTRMLLIILFSIASAALFTMLVTVVIGEIPSLGSALGGTVGGYVIFGNFAISFLISAGSLSRVFLSKTRLVTTPRPAPVYAPVQATGSPPPTLPSIEQISQFDGSPKASDPELEVEPAAEEEPAEEEPAEEEPAEEEIKEPLTPFAEKQKVFMMMFLGQALEHVKSTQKIMDAFNKLGVSLFLAGACEALSRDREMDEETATTILSESVQVLGYKTSQARSFAERSEDYLLADSRYMQMYQSGRNAMNTFIGGDAEGTGQMATALVEWNKPKQKEEKTGPVTVMFTDMVGSTALTQTRGDAVAQQVVRTHNRIVREALNRHEGREIKHTGDGIMASFSTTSNGVEAAIFIQKRTAAHNAAQPDLPLHLKIGINAGEPISEDDDLFGTTVQLSARIVDKAQSEQIFVSETVRGICAGSQLAFINRGGYDMKGFDHPITLFEVVWQDSALANAAATQPTQAPAAQPAAPPQAVPAQPATSTDANPTQSAAGRPAAAATGTAPSAQVGAQPQSPPAAKERASN